MSKDNTQHFNDAFRKFLDDRELKQVYNEKRLIGLWSDLMGKTIAARTSRIFIKNKVMYVTLTSAPLKQQLMASKQKVLDRIEDHFGEQIVEEVRFL